jgi:hypothetical protein
MRFLSLICAVVSVVFRLNERPQELPSCCTMQRCIATIFTRYSVPGASFKCPRLLQDGLGVDTSVESR